MYGNLARDPRLVGLGAALSVLAVVIVGVLVLDGGAEEGDVAAEHGGCRQAELPPGRTVDLDRPDPGSTVSPRQAARAVVDTSCGSFTIELDTGRSHRTADSFAYLAEQGAFDDTHFHRIVPGFVIQGGDPEGTGSGGAGYTIREAPPAGTEYVPGVVAMAKSADSPPGTSQSQFFVVTGEGGAALTAEYAVVGKVVEGMDVVERVGGLGGPDEAPTEVVVIESVTLETS